MVTDDDMREELYRAVHEAFIGPMDPASQEVLKWVSPKKAYSSAVLYPQGSVVNEGDIADDDDDDNSDDAEERISSASAEDAHGEENDNLPPERDSVSLAEEEDPVILSNAYRPSAMSLTIAIGESEHLTLKVRAASYEKEKTDDGVLYKRAPIMQTLDKVRVPDQSHPVVERSVEGESLSMKLVYRYSVRDVRVVTVALKNDKRAGNERGCFFGNCYYQCGFIVISSAGFFPLPAMDGENRARDEEERSADLIYSEVKTYAIGHGCSADWSDETPYPLRLETRSMPCVEVKPISFEVRELAGRTFDMYVFGEPARWNETRRSLESLCDEYEAWIDRTGEDGKAFPEPWKRDAASANIDGCARCLSRMRAGLRELEENPDAREAFQRANRAMLRQYLHYSFVANECDHVRPEQEGIRSWRPFQIAFILMCIASIVDAASEDRDLVDLIWFPTGGGKTEAYLGLAAFVLVLERLNGEACTGTSVIMRYTLRLLSSQQFARASTLICALEAMRRGESDRLGPKPFSIGFWVGEKASPNTWKRAVDIFNDLRDGAPKKSLPVTQCPWCGAPMGKDAAGYKRVRNRDQGREGDYYLLFVCPNEDCDFGKKDQPLPLKVVDDEIYFDPPSLLLGTVDKFATIPFRSKSYRIFGIDDHGKRAHTPKLIIQDELHLLSGPLGSMTAHYETLVDSLCTAGDGDALVRPKIIASTATVSRAREQCHELFACGKENVLQFPPPGISYTDSFFSRLDKEDSGRRYVGLYAPTLTYANASIRLYTELLWEPNRWNLESVGEGDRYWTVIGYYQSIRELGQARTWTDSDIPARLKERRRRNPNSQKRYLNAAGVMELTGRKDADEGRDGLKRLERRRSEKGCVDLCLATNMISVGLDVPRLGVMVVAGQPKGTAEYIQASSRIGRGDSKGMVFVLYGTARPRDRSHYENFRSYHESLYRHVEPSSVTAFCEQVRARALPGTLVGLYRAIDPSRSSPNHPDEDILDKLCDSIASRVQRVDPEEELATRSQLAEIKATWLSGGYERWESLNPHPCASEAEAAVPLIYPWGGEKRSEWGDESFEAPLSLRSVDQECKVRVVGHYPSDDEERE